MQESDRFFQRAFRTNPMVSFNVLGLVFDVEEPQTIDMSPSQALEYERWLAWWVDFSLGRYRSAYDRLKRLAKREYDEEKHPDRVPDGLLWYRGVAAAHTLYLDSAIADFRVLMQRAITKSQRNEVVHVPLNDNGYRFMLAALHDVAGHTDSAVALYQEALEHDLGLVMAHTYLASIYDKAGRAEDAMLERRRVDEDLGRVRDAREHYTEFLERSPLKMEDWRASAQQRLDSLPK